jgi:hypothetical protein
MSIQHKIQNVYDTYITNGKNKKKVKELVDLSEPTITKYIKIKENIHKDLLPYFDSKEKKLTIDISYILLSNFVKQDTQYDIFINHLEKGNKKNKQIINVLTMCNICCENTKTITKLPCCNQYICDNCLLQHIVTKMTDISFHSIRCMYCSVIMRLSYIDKLLYMRYIHKEKWMKDWTIRKKYNENYLYNVLQLYYCMLLQIEKIHNENSIYITDINIDEELPKILEKHVYGICYKCCPYITTKHKYHTNTWSKIKMKALPKECVNNENNEVILTKDMFLCEKCDELEKTVKKCPHCGIQSIRPNECNFVICRCGNNWCFLCGCRLLNDRNGHNVHYYIGTGSGPYNNECRVTTNHTSPSFEILSCSCNLCSQRQGRSICWHLDCQNISLDSKRYCQDHDI